MQKLNGTTVREESDTPCRENRPFALELQASRRILVHHKLHKKLAIHVKIQKQILSDLSSNIASGFESGL